MQCSACGFESPEGMSFCGSCGRSLEIACARCGERNPPGFQFCGHCGESLGAGAPEPVPDTAERRQLTVMFCDLVGSTALSTHLDPEDLREILRGYQEMTSEVVARYEGHVAQHLGDGILIYFGYPKAHEDDARRAVHAALGVVEGMDGLNDRLARQDLPLMVRVGVHTGPVVTGELGTGETGGALALGATPNVAAGIQNVARPNGVVLSAASYELVEGFFACRSLGPKKLRTASHPIEVFEVVGASGVRSRFELAVHQGLGPLIGRRRELVQLRDRFYQASDGEGQIVEMTGEGGIGKSRQVHEFRKTVSIMPHEWRTCRASPYGQREDFHPFLEHLAEYFTLHHEDTAETKLGKIREAALRLGFSPASVAPLARLLSVPFEGVSASKEPGPEAWRREVSELLRAVLLDLSGEKPLVLVVEDLQWADPASVAFLESFSATVGSARILVVLTFRPAFHPPWPREAHVTRIQLDRLVDEEEEMLVEEVTGGKPLDPPILERILEMADGVPLYIEELTRTVLESDQVNETEDGYELAVPELDLGIPPTLQDALMARLDHDPETKKLAQLAAALEPEFDFQLLRTVSGLDGEDLESRLRRLEEEGLLICFGEPPHATYSFRHSLIRAAAYESVLKSTRPQYHQGVADALIEQAPEVARSEPQLVARHLSRGNRPDLAVGYWLRAGRQSLRRGECVQAQKHLAKGLRALAALPGEERGDQEIALRCAYGTALAASNGWQAPEVAEMYSRIDELCAASSPDGPPERFWALAGRWRMDLMRPDLGAALRKGRELVRMADALAEPEMVAEGEAALGAALLFHGELVEAREHLERARDLESASNAAAEDGYLIIATAVQVRCWLSLALWHLGRADQGLAESVAAIGFARRLEHPTSLAYALAFGSWFHACRREEELVHERAEEMLYLAQKHGLHMAVWARFFLAVRAIAQGVPAGGWRLGDEAAVRARGRAEPGVAKTLGQASAAALMAVHAAAEGRLEDAAERLASALDAIRATGEHHWEAELHRLQGELVLSRGGAEAVEAAEASFRKALDIAQRQGSRALELRAATSLARLWRRLERRREAREVLEGVHAAHTEGHDTPDLIEAAKLLSSLSA